ncbi:exodeoxyribonuclease V subunit gamma [Balneolaceae bacterium YR4-1]|uniref:Exodeoxyribonuclease V subunit gamma n=1 Tax=Halalkalibaculum roseum TaxID=2709311 RepID=A0A6M1SW63_9BACT|nr:exodeoxyribonuclease V subunit gamma [Halalkalibaculum roseum]NGP76346.1 exodeoxyribonuclease V subunit gamma [Halalkalibaculum roseum]
MLTYCSGTDLFDLVDELLKQFDADPLQNPLSPEIFIVQNHGMAHWLSLYMAEENGIAANMSFEFPAERIWNLIRMVNSDIPDTLPSDRLPMTWSLLNILRNEDDKELDILNEYVEEEDPVKREMRRWKLAGRIADVFDQYLTYRPTMLTSWEKGRSVTDYREERWQAHLWRNLMEYWSSSSKTEHKHRAKLQQQLLKGLKADIIDLKKLPQRISVFGVSTMPPIYLRILVKLSRLTDVYFYVLEPAGRGDHPIYESMGKTGKEFRSLLKSYMTEYEIEPKILDRRKKRDTHHSLLASFQNSLLGYDTDKADSTDEHILSIHSCHSARREVEVLYDQLLGMLEEDENLNPSEILVLTPDLASYASEIKAVFDTVEESLPEIPFHLTEKNIGRLHPVAQTVVKLLELVNSRFKVTEILDLLDSKPLQHKFQFTEDDLNTLERWIDDTRIRWGIDKSSKGKIGLPETESFTWRSGINRMMLGYAMKEDDDRLFEGIFPYREIERSEDALLAGRFSKLMSLFFKFHDDIKEAKSVSEWAKRIRSWIFDFIPEDEDYFHAAQRIRNQLEKLEEMETLSGFSETIPFKVVQDYLISELEEQKSGGGRSSKGVTFSSMIPFRNIPAKVICLLGMNDGIFPRSKMPMAFDLINKSPRPGDRSHSDEDRQLFLETILAARNWLYISYTGQSNLQDTEFPPSVVLRELQDYFQDAYDLKKEEFITKHPLQSFSPKYFRSERKAGIFSYSSSNRTVANQLLHSDGESPPFIDTELPQPGEEYLRVSVSELVRFFQHPAKYLLQNRFGIYLERDNILDEDREPFQLDGLQGYKLGQELLNRNINNQSLEAFKKVAESTSFLPDGFPGEEAYYEKSSEVKLFIDEIGEIFDQKKLEAIEVDFEIGDFRITGKLQDVYEEEQIFYRFGRMRSKEQIELWIKHLVLQETIPMNHKGTSKMYAYSNKEGVRSVLLPVVEDYKSTLSDLLELYHKGLRANIFFFPDTSYTYADNLFVSGNDAEKALDNASKEWKNNYTPYPKEGDDPYNKLLMKDANPLDSNIFMDNSERFWKPYFSYLITEDA